MKIVVCGLGCAGTITAACLMKDGHRVAGIDVSPAKSQAFASGRSPVYEQDKEDLAEYVAARTPRYGCILLLGLTCKPGTGELRESLLVDLAESLLDKGFRLTIHAPDLRLDRLTGVNLELSRTRLRGLCALLTDDVEGALAAADLIVAGKAMPALAGRIAGDARLVDLDRL